MATDEVMIWAHKATRDRLRELAEAEGTSLVEMLDRLVRRAHEDRFLSAVATTLGSAAADGLDPVDDFSGW
jgi:hypothetical protein